VQSMIIGYSGALMPGSLLTYTLDKSIRSGAKAGLLISIGHALLELVLVLLIFLGIGKYLGTTLAQLIIGLLGGIVLVYFGVKMIKDIYAGKVTIDFRKQTESKYGNIIVGGALISATNPYFIVWWAAVGMGLIMNAYNTFGLTGVILFYLGHIASDITWYVFVSTLISKTRSFINQKVYRIIVTILGICLIGFGASFLIASAKIVWHYL
jgi:threonine/homoserine/homoserine lactone efflux protein